MSRDHYRWQGSNLLLFCHIQPKASKDEIVGLYGDSVKIRITAPPVEGKANAHLTRFLAKTFGIPKTAVKILSGANGKRKQVLLKNPLTLPEQLNIEPR